MVRRTGPHPVKSDYPCHQPTFPDTVTIEPYEDDKGCKPEKDGGGPQQTVVGGEYLEKLIVCER
jgi:hypothetical protein